MFINVICSKCSILNVNFTHVNSQHLYLLALAKNKELSVSELSVGIAVT